MALEATSSHRNGHVGTYDDDEGNKKPCCEPEDTQIPHSVAVGSGGTVCFVFVCLQFSIRCERDAAGHGSHPDEQTCYTSFKRGAFVLSPNDHPCGQATVQTDGSQQEDACKHVEHSHKAIKLAHEETKVPDESLGNVCNAQYQEEGEEEVCQGQVEKPDGIDCGLHFVACHINDQTVPNCANYKHCYVGDQAEDLGVGQALLSSTAGAGICWEGNCSITQIQG